MTDGVEVFKVINHAEGVVYHKGSNCPILGGSELIRRYHELQWRSIRAKKKKNNANKKRRVEITC